MAARVLVVDDEDNVRELLRNFLKRAGYEVVEARSCAEGIERFSDAHPDAVVSDYQLTDGTALDLLPRFKAQRPFVPVIVVTGHATIELAVKAMKEGADQFISKPLELPALAIVLERALDMQRMRRKEEGAKPGPALDPFLGTSATIRRLADEAKRIAPAESPVLLTGETGSGKGVLAAWIHRNSPRLHEPMVSLNCAGLNHDLLESELFGHEKGAFTGAVAAKAGLLEVAHRGTVFLDEIGDMEVAVQPKLLKVLEEQRFRRVGDVRDRVVDIRLVAATHQDLASLVRENRFRSDLYFRVSAIPLRVPSLRDRPEDIHLLAQQMLERFQGDMGRPGLALSPGARQKCERYSWPGNLRELRNVLERAVLLTDRTVLEPSDLRFDESSLLAEVTGSTSAGKTLAEVERAHVERTLADCGGNVIDAARILGLSRSALYDRLRRDGIASSPAGKHPAGR
jgi:DNA-binding NtrC family response regulator